MSDCSEALTGWGLVVVNGAGRAEGTVVTDAAPVRGEGVATGLSPAEEKRCSPTSPPRLRTPAAASTQ
jgi:hypothetical protein